MPYNTQVAPPKHPAPMSEFKVGDVIVSKRGFRPLEVISIDPRWGDCTLYYLHNRKIKVESKADMEEHYKLYEHQENAKTTMANNLYSFKRSDGTLALGIHIGTNSQNKFLIEEKETGEIHILDREDLEEVLPYTFSVSTYNSFRETHFIGKRDRLKVGDILLYTGDGAPKIVFVTAVDTKNRGAKEFKGTKIMTEEI
jgi:hypothetical protein